MSGRKRGYKRSWKNYFLNTRYQMRFTLFMVALCAVLMGVLGFWLDDIGKLAANGARKAGLESIATRLQSVREWKGAEDAQRALADYDFKPAPSRGLVNWLETWPSITSEARNATKVGESNIQGSALDEAQQAKEIGVLHAKENRLTAILYAIGAALCLLLFAYGIKMTHKVAGPLYKITLYLDKVKNNKFDKVYSLRKGDQLVAFFDHFREAHETLRRRQEQDVARLREIVGAAEQANLGARSPQLAAALADLKQLLQSKEASLG